MTDMRSNARIKNPIMPPTIAIVSIFNRVMEIPPIKAPVDVPVLSAGLLET